MLHGFTEHAKTIPLMVGSVFGEFKFEPVPFDKRALSEQEVQEVLEERYGEHTQKVVELFRKTYPDKHVLDVLMLDRVFRIPSKELARLHAGAQKAPTYLYQFVLDFPIWNGKPAWHCADIPFFFHNTELVEVCGILEAQGLEEQLCRAVVSFAKTANPNQGALLRWPAVTIDEEPTMIFDRTCSVGLNYDDALLKLLEEISPSFNIMELLMQQDIQH